MLGADRASASLPPDCIRRPGATDRTPAPATCCSQALAACAGVTMRSVATAIGVDASGVVRAEGNLDFRGTLGVDKEAPVGFSDIRLSFRAPERCLGRGARHTAASDGAVLRRAPDAGEQSTTDGDDRLIPDPIRLPSSIAASRLPRRGAPARTFSGPVVQAGGEDLPFGSDTFDSLSSSCTWKHWPDPARGVSECVRVTRPEVRLSSSAKARDPKVSKPGVSPIA